jgi:hypothetical protein
LSYESRSHEYFGAGSIDLLHSWKRQVDFRELGHIAEEESKLGRRCSWMMVGSGTMDDVEVWVADASSIHGQFGAGFGCQLVLCLVEPLLIFVVPTGLGCAASSFLTSSPV